MAGEINQSNSSGSSFDEKTWNLVVWGLGLIGIILFYAMGPKESDRVKHWVRLSIALLIIAVIGWVIVLVASPVPLLGTLLYIIVGIGVAGAWVLGILKILNNEKWYPPLLTDIASRINI